MTRSNCHSQECSEINVNLQVPTILVQLVTATEDGEFTPVDTQATEQVFRWRITSVPDDEVLLSGVLLLHDSFHGVYKFDLPAPEDLLEAVEAGKIYGLSVALDDDPDYVLAGVITLKFTDVGQCQDLRSVIGKPCGLSVLRAWLDPAPEINMLNGALMNESMLNGFFLNRNNDIVESNDRLYGPDVLNDYRRFGPGNDDRRVYQ